MTIYTTITPKYQTPALAETIKRLGVELCYPAFKHVLCKQPVEGEPTCLFPQWDKAKIWPAISPHYNKGCRLSMVNDEPGKNFKSPLGGAQMGNTGDLLELARVVNEWQCLSRTRTGAYEALGCHRNFTPSAAWLKRLDKLVPVWDAVSGIHFTSVGYGYWAKIPDMRKNLRAVIEPIVERMGEHSRLVVMVCQCYTLGSPLFGMRVMPAMMEAIRDAACEYGPEDRTDLCLFEAPGAAWQSSPNYSDYGLDEHLAGCVETLSA